MSTNGLLTEKEQELVAVGASIAAGCRPCTAYHVRAARVAGADKEEIRQAVNDALDVRQQRVRHHGSVSRQVSGRRASGRRPA